MFNSKYFIVISSTLTSIIGIGWMIQLGAFSRNIQRTATPAVSWHIERDESYSNEFNALLDQCEQGDIQACDEAENTLYNFDDMNRVVYIANHRCNEGDSRQCAYVGEIYLHAIKGMIYDPAKAHSYLTSACEGGDQRGCDLLKEYHDVNGTKMHDRATMAEQLKNKCEQGSHESCIGVAEMLHRGSGVKIDLESALRYYKKGCNTPEINTDPRCENAYEIIEQVENQK